MEIFNVKDLTFTYPGCASPTLNKISFSVQTGEFIVICGETGCGKTTLLKMLKPQLTPRGQVSGSVVYCGKAIDENEKVTAGSIGFVQQNPRQQIVADKVYKELAFGLENQNTDPVLMKRKIAEIVNWFGIESSLHKSVDTLSGGSCQLLNLAAVMVLSPKVIILDEPTAGLDPIAAERLMSTLRRLNRELNITIILTEHHLDAVLNGADRLMAMEKGEILCFDRPKVVFSQLRNHKLHHVLPAATQIFYGLEQTGDSPISVKEGHAFIANRYKNEKKSISVPQTDIRSMPVIQMKNIYFRYEKHGKDILKGANLSVNAGECFALLGANGSGKSTLFGLLSGIFKPYSGKIRLHGKVACLSQYPTDLFVHDTVLEDFKEIADLLKADDKILDTLIDTLQIRHLLSRHPFDLSGGEQQKCALVKVLLTSPQILLLDEPTTGIDAFSKLALSDWMHRLQAAGITIVMATHDIDFAAEHADRCGMLFDGEMIGIDTANRFFSQNRYYTTSAHIMTQDLFENAVTNKDVIKLCLENGVKS